MAAAAIVGGSMLGSALINKSGSKGGTTQTNATSAPWEGQQPYLRDLMARSNELSRNSAAIGPQSPQTLQAQQLQQQRAMSGSPLNQAAQQQNLQTLQGGYLNPYTSGALGDVMGMTASKINSQFGGDNFGNSAHQEWLGRGLMGASMPYAQQAYDSERQRQMGASALAPTLANQDYADIGQLGAVGAAKDARSQAELMAPWDLLSRYQGQIAGTGGGQSSAQTPYFQNPMANALGMGIGGMQLYNMMGQGGLMGQAPMGQEMVAGQYGLGNPAYG